MAGTTAYTLMYKPVDIQLLDIGYRSGVERNMSKLHGMVEIIKDSSISRDIKAAVSNLDNILIRELGLDQPAPASYNKQTAFFKQATRMGKKIKSELGMA